MGCIHGDLRSQELVYKMFSGRMMVVCVRYLKSREDAEDLLQEGFIKAFQQIHQFKGNGAFEGWLRRMFVNLCLDTLRKNKGIRWVSTDNNEIPSEITNEHEDNDVDFDFTPEQVLNAMEKLSPVYRTVFNLIAFEEFTHQDVAEQLGITVGTSKSNYFKAKKNLQRILLDTI
jgi:RNA polymerase sigma-70 factor (ECF subfamily)